MVKQTLAVIDCNILLFTELLQSKLLFFTESLGFDGVIYEVQEGRGFDLRALFKLFKFFFLGD